jgi:hypothetical protein
MRQEEIIEENRFEVYKRAWFLKHRKSISMGGNDVNGLDPNKINTF